MIPVAFELAVGANNEADRFREDCFLEQVKSAVPKPEMVFTLKYCKASLVPRYSDVRILYNPCLSWVFLSWFGQTKEIWWSFPRLCQPSTFHIYGGFYKHFPSSISLSSQDSFCPLGFIIFTEEDSVVWAPGPRRLLPKHTASVESQCSLLKSPEFLCVQFFIFKPQNSFLFVWCLFDDCFIQLFLLCFLFYFKTPLSFLTLSRKATEKTIQSLLWFPFCSPLDLIVADPSKAMSKILRQTSKESHLDFYGGALGERRQIRAWYPINKYVPIWS